MIRPRLFRMLAAIALAFGALTIASGGLALFGPDPARAAMGRVVGFVLWFNFCAGFAYLAAGAGLWARRAWAPWCGAALTLATALVAAAFAWHALGAGGYEMRALGALAVRLAFWAVWTALVWRSAAAPG